MNPFYILLLAFLSAACGVKGPPLPPVADTPQSSDERAILQSPLDSGVTAPANMSNIESAPRPGGPMSTPKAISVDPRNSLSPDAKLNSEPKTKKGP